MHELLADFSDRALRYIVGVDARPVAPSREDVARLTRLDEPLPDDPTDPRAVLRILDEVGSPATVATTGRRYFGFVTGGSLPAALGANLLAAVWDQNGAYRVGSPTAAAGEEIAAGWVRDVLGVPASAGAGFMA